MQNIPYEWRIFCMSPTYSSQFYCKVMIHIVSCGNNVVRWELHSAAMALFLSHMPKNDPTSEPILFAHRYNSSLHPTKLLTFTAHLVPRTPLQQKMPLGTERAREYSTTKSYDLPCNRVCRQKPFTISNG